MDSCNLQLRALRVLRGELFFLSGQIRNSKFAISLSCRLHFVPFVYFVVRPFAGQGTRPALRSHVLNAANTAAQREQPFLNDLTTSEKHNVRPQPESPFARTPAARER